MGVEGGPVSGASRAFEGLRARGLTVAVAESLTAGSVCAAVARIPGASAVLRGGVVAYATEVKTDVLGVEQGLVERHGVVSAECAASMAARVRLLCGADLGLATTGVAGPDLQEGKPAGTAFVGLAGAGFEARALALQLDGDRRAIVEQTVDAAWAALADAV